MTLRTLYPYLRTALLVVLMELMAFSPALAAAVPQVQAADTVQNQASGCTLFSNSTDEQVASEEDDPGEATEAPSVDLEEFRKDPLFKLIGQAGFDQFVKDTKGWYDTTTKRWYFCTTDMTPLYSPFSMSGAARKYLNTLSLPEDMIEFKNELDYYALTGERCRKFNGDVCDSTKAKVDDQGSIIPPDSNGKQDTVQDPCLKGEARYTEGYKALYYDDTAWPNGCWDAPKADQRILKTLIYLITPVSQGGAGREHIRVSRILQEREENAEFAGSDDSSEEEDEQGHVASAHFYDRTPPGKPEKISQAVDIDEIDKLRITTEVIKRKRAGGSSKSYSYQDYPIKVSWQDANNLDKNGGLPPIDLYTGAQNDMSASILEMLNEYGFEEGEIAISDVSFNNLGSIAEFMGDQMMNRLLGGANGSLSGNTMDDILDKLGRAYIGQELGLPAGALAKGDTPEEITENIGRSKIEQAFDLPYGSLEGSTPQEIFTNVGRRFLEKVVFRVSEGTLLPPPQNIDEMLIRIGEGRIESRFKLAPQSLRITKDGKQRSLDDLKKSSGKARLIFSELETQYVDEALDLTFVDADKGDIDAYGFKKDDYQTPTEDLVKNQHGMGLNKYMRMVGSRAVQSGIGIFSSEVLEQRYSDPNNSFVPYVLSLFGAQAEYTQPPEPGSFPTNRDGVFTIRHRIPRVDAYTKVLNDPSADELIGEILKKDDKGLYYSDLAQNLAQTTYQTPQGKKTLMDEATLTGLVRDIVQLELGGRYNLSEFANGDKGKEDQLDTHVQQIRTEINRLMPPGWRQRFVQYQSAASNEIERRENKAELIDDNLQRSYEALTGIVSRIDQYDEALITIQDQRNQTGSSAAFGFPAVLWKVGPNGEMVKVDSSEDVMKAVLTGNYAVLPLLGKLYAVTKIVPDKARQRSLAAEIANDTNAMAFRNPQRLGITEEQLLTKGLQLGDFGRIFSQGLSKQVFRRVGEQELLRVLWNKSDLTDSKTAGNVVDAINTASAKYDFYEQRIDRLGEIRKEVLTDVEAYLRDHKDIDAKLKTALTAFKDKLERFDSRKAKSNLKEMRQATDDLSVAFDEIEPLLSENQPPGTTIRAGVLEALHIIREIIAGHELDFKNAGSGGSNRSREGCLKDVTLRNFLRNKDRNFSDIALEVAACRVDTGLNLPEGSTYIWYRSGTRSLEEFEASVGYADADNRDVDRPERQEAIKIGKKIIASRLAFALGNEIPGAQQFIAKYDISADDIVLLLNGDSTALIRKIGGSMIDYYFKWPAGTGRDIINPICYREDGKTQRSCSSKERENMRYAALATVSLQKLGVDLNFPPSFNFTAGGNFINNYGVAAVSDYLGLQPNSFKDDPAGKVGSFEYVLSLNNPKVMLRAFRADSFPLLQKAEQLVSNLTEAVRPSEREGNEFLRYLEQQINNRRNDYLQDFRNQPTPFWIPTTVDQIKQEMPSEAEWYANFLRGAQARANSDSLQDSPTLINILNSSLEEIESHGKNDGYWGETYADGQLAAYQAFQQRVNELDKQFNLKERDAGVKGTPTANQLGTFAQFIFGLVTAESITKSVGKSDLMYGPGAKLSDDYVKKHLKQGTWLYEVIVEGLPMLTKSEECTSGMSIGTLVFNDPNTQCGIEGIGNIDFKAILTEESPMRITQRAFLFDHLFARVFSAEFEENLGLEAGTVRAMALEPSKSRDILIEQGLTRFATQVFGANPGDSDDLRDAKSAFKEAFLVGFYDAKQGKYTLTFNKQRSLAAMEEHFKEYLFEKFAPLNNRYFGSNVSFADFEKIYSGDVNALKFLGLMYFTYQINEGLSKTDDRRSHDLMIDYNLIREVVGIVRYTGPELDAAVSNNEYDFITGFYCNPESIWASSGFSISTTCPDPSQYETKEAYVSAFKNQANEGEKAILNEVVTKPATSYYQEQHRQKKQDELTFKMLDAMAFKADHNIPSGFTYAMYRGTKQQKTRALGIYALGALGVISKETREKYGITEAAVYDLTFVYGKCIISSKEPSQCKANESSMAAITGIDAWLRENAEGMFGFELPPGTFAGFVAWAGTGFDKHAFDNAELSLGGHKVPAIGFILKDIAVQNISAWADRRLGTEPGSAYRIYKAYQQYYQAAKVYRDSLTMVNALDGYLMDLGEEMGSLREQMEVATGAEKEKLANTLKDKQAEFDDLDAFKKDTMDPEVKANRAKTQELKAALITLAITLIFDSQIADAEQAIGLVPGTGSMAVGMIVQALMGVPIDPITIALFVGINLFGVYKVEVNIRATGDGYYPIVNDPSKGSSFITIGYDNAITEQGLYVHTPHPQEPRLGDFDAKKQATYRAGALATAQNKVRGLLTDLLVMPKTYGTYTGTDPRTLWISQVFTYRNEDLSALDYLISQPAPWDTPAGWGYGSLESRSKLTFNSTTGKYVATATDDQRAGYFSKKMFWDHIHVRW